MIKPIDVNLNDDSAETQALAESFSVKTVPHVAVEYKDGRRIKYNGERTAEAYLNWLYSN